MWASNTIKKIARKLSLYFRGEEYFYTLFKLFNFADNLAPILSRKT
jgi:hypothetical protein